MKRDSKKRRRLNLWDTDPSCYWCGIETVMPPDGISSRGDIPDNEATIDHLRTKFDSTRLDPNHSNEERTVLSCRKCNWERGRESEKEAGIEELRRRSQLVPKKKRKTNDVSKT
jgi:hypothetical protein